MTFLFLGGIYILNVRKMVLSSLFASLMALCSWLSISVPPVAFTLQTFGLFLSLLVLGGKWGSVSLATYLFLGIVGLPVFSGFRGGAAALLDPTGGFLWGFLVAALAYWALERLGKIPAMAAALLVCYGCGCWWFAQYSGGGIWAAAMTCVAPYLIPDGIKLWLAWAMSKRLHKHI